jgi:hypothetical protein
LAEAISHAVTRPSSPSPARRGYPLTEVRILDLLIWFVEADRERKE